LPIMPTTTDNMCNENVILRAFQSEMLKSKKEHIIAPARSWEDIFFARG
jgi:hypothetical protein